MELFSDIVGPLAGLYITAHSPVELVLTAPDGMQTGLNPLTNVRSSSIPQSGYGDFSSLANDENHAFPPLPPSKTVAVVDPANGDYALQVIGTGTGPFTLDFIGYDANGNRTVMTLNGNTRLGLVLNYGIKYSSLPGAPLEIKPPLTIGDVIAVVQLARTQGRIYNDGIANSLIKKLQNAAAALARGETAAAKNILQAFANEVSAQAGRQIQTETAAILTADVLTLMPTL
jgi:hypothetical protein